MQSTKMSTNGWLGKDWISSTPSAISKMYASGYFMVSYKLLTVFSIPMASTATDDPNVAVSLVLTATYPKKDASLLVWVL